MVLAIEERAYDFKQLLAVCYNLEVCDIRDDSQLISIHMMVIVVRMDCGGSNRDL